MTKTVEVRITESLIEVFHAGQRVGSHQRSYCSGEVVTDPAHLHPRHAAYAESLSLDSLNARLVATGPSVGALADLWSGAPPVSEAKRRLLGRLVDLSHIHGANELGDACAWALANNTTEPDLANFGRFGRLIAAYFRRTPSQPFTWKPKVV